MTGLTPQALQRLLGPSGPLLHSAVTLTPQPWHRPSSADCFLSSITIPPKRPAPVPAPVLAPVPVPRPLPLELVFMFMFWPILVGSSENLAKLASKFSSVIVERRDELRLVPVPAFPSDKGGKEPLLVGVGPLVEWTPAPF